MKLYSKDGIFITSNTEENGRRLYAYFKEIGYFEWKKQQARLREQQPKPVQVAKQPKSKRKAKGVHDSSPLFQDGAAGKTE